MDRTSREAREEVIRRLTLAGASLQECMNATGMRLSGVRDARQRLGVAGHPRNPVPPSVLAKARDLVEDGASFAEIARTLGIGEGTIHRHFKGRAWNKEQTAEYNRMRRPYDLSEDFKVVFPVRREES